MGVLEFVGNDHFWKRHGIIYADMEVFFRRKERRKEGVYRGSGAVVYSSQDREKEAG